MFSRQIYITKNNNSHLIHNFKLTRFEDYSVYYHNLNSVFSYEGNGFRVMIIGAIVHPEYDFFDIKKIIESRNLSELNFDSINRVFDRCVGRYYLFYQGQDGGFLRSDPTSLAQINYSKKDSIIATDINLLKETSSQLTDNIDALNFYKNTLPNKGNGDSWVGSESIYKEINKVLPNHAINLADFSVVRYWPFEKFEIKDFDESVKKISSDLRATLKALSNIAPLSIAVTAGNDSRVMLAASKDIKDKCYYFIDKLPYMPDSHTDLTIGKKACDCMGVKFNIHNNLLSISEIPSEFKEEYRKSVFFSTDRRMPEVYNYREKLSSYINICGIGEFGRSVYGAPKVSASALYLCSNYQCGNSDYAKNVTNKWIKDYKSVQLLKGYPINTMYYIEHRLGNWGAVGNAESDIAFEEINPFASHHIISMMLMLKEEYNGYVNNMLFSALVHDMAPELDDIPINPSVTKKQKLVKYIKGLNIYPLLNDIRIALKSLIVAKVD